MKERMMEKKNNSNKGLAMKGLMQMEKE